jgi:hypothetical protein
MFRIFRGTQLGTSNEPAKILIAFARGTKQGHTGQISWFFRIATRQQQRNLRPNVRLDLQFPSREIKARCAINPIAIEQAHRRHFMLGTDFGKLFRNRSSFEKAEGGAGVEFDIQDSGQLSVNQS